MALDVAVILGCGVVSLVFLCIAFVLNTMRSSAFPQITSVLQLLFVSLSGAMGMFTLFITQFLIRIEAGTSTVADLYDYFDSIIAAVMLPLSILVVLGIAFFMIVAWKGALAWGKKVI